MTAKKRVQYEYEILHFKPGKSLTISYLNERGAEGWQLVDKDLFDAGRGTFWRLIFMRVKPAIGG